eukprot:CAMPEP_0185834432 /NCGR_PEP_ID=MMETSP1353-20130828/5294_1 /TAXON_ID=1077150 /ORGANISM="Erythrolobus australicus, Strain CCMP3124" /LENGTH=253 /DNA_ID=CAMNT_0028532857 /DNA_START=9 /DNA_END=770 /DNA_ORIENTATION=+
MNNDFPEASHSDAEHVALENARTTRLQQTQQNNADAEQQHIEETLTPEDARSKLSRRVLPTPRSSKRIANARRQSQSVRLEEVHDPRPDESRVLSARPAQSAESLRIEPLTAPVAVRLGEAAEPDCGAEGDPSLCIACAHLDLGNTEQFTVEQLALKTVVELREALREHGECSRGLKAELVERFAEHMLDSKQRSAAANKAADHVAEICRPIDSLTVKQLRAQLSAHGLATDGSKRELAERLARACDVHVVDP